MVEASLPLRDTQGFCTVQATPQPKNTPEFYVVGATPSLAKQGCCVAEAIKQVQLLQILRVLLGLQVPRPHEFQLQCLQFAVEPVENPRLLTINCVMEVAHTPREKHEYLVFEISTGKNHSPIQMRH